LALCLLCAAWTIGPSPAYAQQSTAAYSEDAIKAVFLYRFAAYVVWPPSRSTDPVFTIGVINADGVADELERLLAHHMVKDRRARVRRISNPGDIGDSMIVYVGGGGTQALQTVLAHIERAPVLLVTDAERGLDSGSAINFRIVDSHVRFEVSLAAADRAGLSIRSELLSVAIRVSRGNVEGSYER